MPCHISPYFLFYDSKKIVCYCVINGLESCASYCLRTESNLIFVSVFRRCVGVQGDPNEIPVLFIDNITDLIDGVFEMLDSFFCEPPYARHIDAVQNVVFIEGSSQLGFYLTWQPDISKPFEKAPLYSIRAEMG